MYEKYLKRYFDFTISLVAIIVLSPMIALIAILVKAKLGSPVIFHQERVGSDEKVFLIFKFRTMTNERNSAGQLLPDSKRLSTFGKILRSTSLDELPSLLNVLKGDMSLVGPRPLLVEYLAIYSNYHRRRHTVRPGLTGLAQISGRNAVSWKNRFDLDVEYVDNMNFLKDVKIIFLTIKKIILREGIYFCNEDTIYETYKGNTKDE